MQNTYFYNSVFNSFIYLFKKYFNEDSSLREKCILDGSADYIILDFFDEHSTNTIINTISDDREFVRGALEDGLVDVVLLPLSHKIGVYSRQFDFVSVIDELNYIVDPNKWQNAVENLCFYLKPGGICVINSDFHKTTSTASGSFVRSLGVWKAVIRKANPNCSVVEVFDIDPHNVFNRNFKSMMVVRKNE